MSGASIEERTTQGYQAPRNVQFSVFLANKVGKLLELVNVFDGEALRLVALSVVDSADHAVVRVVTSNSDLARKLLCSREMPCSETDILVVELGPNQRLGSLCQSLLAAEVSIHYAYPLMVLSNGSPTIALHTDDQILAGQILLRKRFHLLAENDLHAP